MTLEDEVVRRGRFRKRSIGDIRSFIRRELTDPAVDQLEREPSPTRETYAARENDSGPDLAWLTPESMSSLIGRVGDASVDEVERLIGYLRTARAYLEGEAARLTDEITRFSEASENSLKAAALIQGSIDDWRASVLDRSGVEGDREATPISSGERELEDVAPAIAPRL